MDNALALARPEAFIRSWCDRQDRAGFERSILLASTFRSGSTRIAWSLAANGLPGLDKERFGEMWNFLEPVEPGALAAALGEIFGSSQEGLFTSKVMWPHLRYLLGAAGLGRPDAPRLARLFAPARWVHVVREDKIAQAISFWRAKRSGRWHVFDDSAEPEIAYDFGGILDCLHELAHDDRLWGDFFALCGVVPVRVVYEEFEADVAAGLRSLLTALGLPEPAVLEREVDLRRQSDALSGRLRERFLEEFYRVPAEQDARMP